MQTFQGRRPKGHCMKKQLNLFSRQSFNTTRELKECLSSVVSKSGMSREEFLDLINQLADRFGVRLVKGRGRSLSMATFEKWLNPNNTEHIPHYSAISIICEIGETVAPLQVMAAPIGAMVIGEQDVKLLRWAKEYQMVKEAKRKMRKLEAEF